MEFRQLRSFVEVVRQGSFTQAAQVRHASQSTISKQGNGSGRHRVSPGTVERASWAPSDNGAAPGVVGCVGGQARIVPAVVAKVRCRVYGSAMTSR